MTKLRLTVEYDGTQFCGFQWQPHVRSVAGSLEAALSNLFQEPIKVTGAGRTDSGVHATGQVVSLATQAHFPFERLDVALRRLLGAECAVREVAVVDSAFSARFDALERKYVYAILNRRQPSPLLSRYACHVPWPLKIDAMQEAAMPLLGEHDFRAFAKAGAAEPTRRCITAASIERHGTLIRVEIAADGFLHHMVRTIVGTLVECGLERRAPAEIPAILEGRRRSAAGSTAAPHGLYLAGVRYPDGYDSFAEPPIFGPYARDARLTEDGPFS